MADINVTNEIIDVNVTEEVITVAVDSGAYPLPYPVYSVFGRTGNVVSAEGDYSLTQLSDVTLTSPSNGQVLKYNGTAWVNGADNNSVTSVFGRTGVVVATSGDYTTTQVTEGTNLYYTDVRARASNSFVAGSGAYNSTTGVITIPTNNNQITNGSAFITLTGLSATTPLSYNNTTGAFTISQASTSANGFLASGDFNTFNNKQNALTNPVTGTGTTNTLSKFTGASAIGDSNITDTGSLITLGSNTTISSGGLGIGTSTLTAYNLRISKTITGGTIGYGAMVDGIIQSDVTSQVHMYRSYPSTQAATFNITNLYGFNSSQNSLGAGTTVTNQYGYWCDALSWGTNVYGFHGNVASGTNRWNLYMNGTANNYMAGSLGIGSTSLGGTTLNVSKNLTGATVTYGAYSGGTVQSDSTSSANYFLSQSITAAATFIVSNINHFRAAQGTFGAGSTVTSQSGFVVDSNLTSATNNYGFFGNIPAAANRWNLFMNGTADNYLAGNTGIGVSQTIVSSGPILTTTLTNGGSGYVDGTYTDLASTVVSGGGTYALFTIVVSGGIVTTATLTWGGSTYTAGTTLTVSNTLLGGTGSGLVITVNTVDSSQLTIASTTGADITLLRNDTSLNPNDNIGTIKWVSNDATIKASGNVAEISASGESTNGGAYLAFSTRAGVANSQLVEAMRIAGNGGVGIATGANTLVGYSLRIQKNITGATTAYAIRQDGSVQSDVTSAASNFASFTNTAAAAFTLGSYTHFSAQQGTLGAGSSITTQYGFLVASNLTGATNNYGFYGNIPSGTNRWNLYMNGTAANYMAGQVGIGATSINASAKVQIDSTTQGFLPPVMTTTQKNAIATPATGLVVFDSTLGKLCVFSTTWQTITSV